MIIVENIKISTNFDSAMFQVAMWVSKGRERERERKRKKEIDRERERKRDGERQRESKNEIVYNELVKQIMTRKMSENYGRGVKEEERM